jgi:fatty-acyl-CoA synthase
LRGRITPRYLNDPAATANGFDRDGFLLTGDLGLVDARGWLHFKGRRKELIKSGGINISPAEIEAVLSQHAVVGSVFVTGLKDARLDEIIGAVVIPQDRIMPGDDTAGALRDHCRQSLAPYKVPRHFVFVSAEELPVTSTGKLQRNRLFELFSDPYFSAKIPTS